MNLINISGNSSGKNRISITKFNLLVACASNLFQEIITAPLSLEPSSIEFTNNYINNNNNNLENNLTDISTSISSISMTTTCTKICSNSLYYCVKDIHNVESCEMNTLMLAVVVIAALFTGIFLPLACISIYVCGLYRHIFNCFNTSSKRSEDQSLLERRDFDTLPSMQSVDSDRIIRQPIEKMYKKNPKRYSCPRVSWG